jgi:S-adenosylmethionine synthetase
MVCKLFTSESVTEGHPDKISDRISDAILDAILAEDPNARVACETFVTTGLVLVAGEITARCKVDYAAIARQAIKEAGYTRPEYAFTYDQCAVIVAIHEQSSDIAQAVNKKGSKDPYDTLGAGDQGIMYGYACTETPQLMPLTITLAQGLAQRLSHVRKEGILSYLRPDGKSQVTIECTDHKPKRAHTVILSAQHDPDIEMSQLREDLIRHVILPVMGDWVDDDTKYLINPSDRFVIGGPPGDTGMTGRKIEVDTYGGYGSHGGGAFSGKDPSKVDRSGSYMARYVAKNIVAAELAQECEVQIAYAIGQAKPISITVDTFGTGIIPDDDLTNIVKKEFDFRPAAIIERLNLRRPIYRPLSAYGHFGRPELNLPWEQIDMADILKREAHALQLA